jgi:regulator of RNase E activity RraA
VGEHDVVVNFAGVIITPGAITYADRDGWLVSDHPL